jgi:hypothetical protein
MQQFAVAEHPISNVIAEQNVVGAVRFGIKKRVKGGDAPYLRRGHPKFFSHAFQRGGR